MNYDVGKIARLLQDNFFAGPLRRPVQAAIDDPGGAANLATPPNVLALLDGLAKVTASVGDDLSRAGDVDRPGLVADLASWEQRMRAYESAVLGATNKTEIFDSVTKPLLIGLRAGGQGPLDAVTPFSLSNQLAVSAAWRERTLELFYRGLADRSAAFATGFADLAEGAGRYVESGSWGTWIALGAGAAATLVLVRALR